MSVTCLIDNTEHESIEALHKYLRPRMKQETYYTQYLAKVDPVTKEPIPFKNADQYLAQDFISKDSIRKWLKAEPVKGREWAVNWLRCRKEEKGLVYAPSQVELRSLQCPSMPYYDHVGGYYAIARELGYADRYHDEITAKAVDMSGATIICDNREQLPLKFTAKTVKGTLNVGDYALASPHDQGIYIERKSLSDFTGTLNRRVNERLKKDGSATLDTAFDRFDRELARAAANGHYIVMLVECTILGALEYDDEQSPYYDRDMRWSKVGPAHAMKNLRDLLVKYPLSFQAAFVDGRMVAARTAIKIFEMGDQVRRIDLQNAHEKGLL